MSTMFKTKCKFLLLVGCVMLFAGAAKVSAAENILGDWVFTMEMPADAGGMGGPGGGGMSMTINSTFSKAADGTITGTWVMNFQAPEGMGAGPGGPGGGMGGAGGMQMPTMKVVDVKIDGQNLSFTRKAEGGDAGGMGGMMSADRKFTGTIKGDAIELKSTSDFGEMTYKGTRKAAAPTTSAAPTTAAAKGLEGDWIFKMSMADSGMGMGAMEFNINSKITKDAQGNYAMTWDQQMTPPPGAEGMGGPGGAGGGFPSPQVKIENIKLEGNKLTFVQKVSFGDMGGMGGGEMTSNFAGTLNGDVIEGKLTSADSGMGPMEFTLKGTRKAAGTATAVAPTAASTGLEGDWDFVTTVADMGFEMGANVTFKKAADGKYSATWEMVMGARGGMSGGPGAPGGPGGAREGGSDAVGHRAGGPGVGGPPGGFQPPTIKIEDIKLDGEKLTFVQKFTMGDMGEMVSKFAGTLKGDKIEGTMTSDMGESKVVGTRKKAATAAVTTPAAAGSDALAGKWEFKLNTGDTGMGAPSEFTINSVITKAADGKYSMTWEQVGDAGGMGQIVAKNEDIKLDGQNLTFVHKVTIMEMEMAYKFTGTVKDNVINGKLAGEGGGDAGMPAMELTLTGKKK